MADLDMELEVSESRGKMPHLSIKWYPVCDTPAMSSGLTKLMGPPVFPLVELPQLHGGLVRFQHACPFMQSHSMMETQENGDK